MSFLIKEDFNPLINFDDLDAITNTDEQIIEDAINSTQNEIESYIRDRFDVSQMFFDVRKYADNIPFETGAITVLFADDFDTNQSYIVGDLVRYKVDNKVFRCIQDTTNEFPTDTAFFVEIGVYNTTYQATQPGTGNNPNDALFWKIIPNRDPLLIRMFVDLVLYEIHSRIAPRNIPEFRIVRRDDVIKYLKMIADPRHNITPNFPLIDHGVDRGVDISFGKTNDEKNTY